jgi:hypothetical protein
VSSQAKPVTSAASAIPFLKKARFSAPFLLGWTANCSHGEPMARCRPSRVHLALAIPLYMCQLVLTENVVARLASCIEHAKRVGLRRAEQPRGKGFILRRQFAHTHTQLDNEETQNTLTEDHTLVFRQGVLRFLVVQLSPLWQAEFQNQPLVELNKSTRFLKGFRVIIGRVRRANAFRSAHARSALGSQGRVKRCVNQVKQWEAHGKATTCKLPVGWWWRLRARRPRREGFCAQFRERVFVSLVLAREEGKNLSELASG